MLCIKSSSKKLTLIVVMLLNNDAVVCFRSGRVSLSRGASLLVDKLTLDDEGWFECRILLLDRTTDEFRNGTWNFLSISGTTGNI